MKHLLTDQITLRHGATLNNRIVMPPMLTYSGKKGGFATEDTINYYTARSQAAGLLITEFHYVSKTGGPCSSIGFPEQLAIYDDEHIESIKKIATALKKDGNKAILQIHHGGRQASGRGKMGKEVLAPSAIDFSFLDYPVREMTNKEIEEIIKDFGRATKRAIEAGFDGVEIHGANHYLLQQFFSKLSNKRSDKWGGSFEKRMAFPLAVVQEVKRVVEAHGPDHFIIGYRISPEEIHEEDVGYTYHESLKLIEEVIEHELDYIHLSLWGGYNSKPVDSAKSYGQLFKDILDDQTKLIIVGNIFSEEDAQDAIDKHTDLIAVGRGTLIDPLFAKKIHDKQGETIVHEITPEQLKKVSWTSGLQEAFTRDDSLGLPKLPNGESIRPFHRGLYD